MKKVELLAPAGNFSKLKTAIHFGADAVYLGGKEFSLRAKADNFSYEELALAVSYAHERGVKVYVTCNIFPKNADFPTAEAYFQYLESIGVDAVLITDVGMLSLVKECAPTLPVHISTQANTLNARAVDFWHKQGAERVVLARELSVKEIKEIHEYNPTCQLEAFVHGAMCISYSGRCLLSNYLTTRDANRGECVQACRFHYTLTETQSGKVLELDEDSHGAYLLNSKDLNMIRHLPLLMAAGVDSFKIEGRMKSEYYLATVVSAYRKAIDFYTAGGEVLPEEIAKIHEKTAHREFTQAYALGDNETTVNYLDSGSKGSSVFIAQVLKGEQGRALVEMRNRFQVGDMLEILSANKEADGKRFTVTQMTDEAGEEVQDAKLVQQKLWVTLPYTLTEGDILMADAKN
ncbi:MAG: U32 family peptidase [Clostridia bacterium]|nr:U32 family peptidase [Clostridia bacterium]